MAALVFSEMTEEEEGEGTGIATAATVQSKNALTRVDQEEEERGRGGIRQKEGGKVFAWPLQQLFPHAACCCYSLL